MVLGKYLAQGQIKKKPPNPNVHQFRDVNHDLSTMILKFSFSNELSRWRLLGRPVFLMCLKNGTPHLHREWQQKTYLWARKLEKWPPLFWTSVLTITDLICAYFGEFCSHYPAASLLLPNRGIDECVMCCMSWYHRAPKKSHFNFNEKMR